MTAPLSQDADHKSEKYHKGQTMKLHYVTGVALAVVAFATVQSHAQDTPPPTPPLAPDAPAASQPGDRVCDVEATVNGVTTKYHYVIRTRDGGDTAGLPPPPPGADGQQVERRQVFMYNDGGPDGHDGHDGPRHMFHMMDMTQLDADKDGKVTFAEFSAPTQDMFNRLDTNHDGTLSADELPKPDMNGPGRGWGGHGMGGHDMGAPGGPGMPPPPWPPECAK